MRPAIEAWAKTNRREIEAARRHRQPVPALRRHLLQHHATDAASTMMALLQVPRIVAWLEALAGTTLRPVDLKRLAVFGFLHDLGKLDPDFQALGDPGRPLPDVVPKHDLIGAVAIGMLRGPLAEMLPGAGLLRTVAGWFAVQTTDTPRSRRTVAPRSGDFDLLDVIAWHHGRPLHRGAERLCRQERFVERNWLGAAPVFVAGLTLLEQRAQRLLPEAFGDAPSRPVTPAFVHAVLGLVILADWLASTWDQRLPVCPGFAWSEDAREDRRTYAALTAEAFLEAVGLSAPARLQLPADLGVLIDQARPTPLQAQAGTIELGPGALLCAEDATGAGKTEFAFAVFARCLAERLCDSLFFALPTRVAAREIFGRIRRLATDKLGIPAHAIVLAVPGYLDDRGAPEDVGATEGEPLGWAQRQSRVFAMARVAVGTIDQALRTTVRLPHAQLGWAGLARSLLVVDEVHASDAYMGELLGRLLRRHRRTGGVAVLLSATLTLEARAGFFFGDAPVAPADRACPLADPAYPALAVARSRAAGPRVVDLGTDPGRRWKPAVAVQRERPGEERAARIAELAAGHGGHGCRVLVVCNWVESAIRAFRLLEGLQAACGGFELLTVAGIPTPHHGRYARIDRELLDAAVSEAFGRETRRTHLILVATQTAEQSLDIDADVLVTDLAPVDVLLQRIGRLWRHPRGDRPLAEPVCHVLAPSDYRPLLDGRPVDGIGAPYRDARMLKAADELLDRSPWDLPAMNRELVEAGVGERALSELAERLDGGSGGRWHEHGLSNEGSAVMERAAARGVLLDIDQPVRNQPVDEGAATRLGARDVLVRLPDTSGPFGRTIDRIPVRARLFGAASPAGDLEAEDVETFPGGFRFSAGRVRFVYDRLGLRRLGDEGTG